MSKLLQQLDNEDHDDVAGLFRRLDGRGERPDAYQVFTEVQPAERAYAPAVPDAPVPVAGPVHAAGHSRLAGHAAAAQQGAGRTPLAQLFERLALARPGMGGESPLSKLRER